MFANLSKAGLSTAATSIESGFAEAISTRHDERLVERWET
jgi:hypothetical protein